MTRIIKAELDHFRRLEIERVLSVLTIFSILVFRLIIGC